MSHRWLSRRALLLHLALVIWFPGCLIAFWWQVHRAFSGNGLSYLYSVEWPVFAVTGVWAWWQLVHTDPEAVGRRAQERMAAAGAGAAVAPHSTDQAGRASVEPDGATLRALLGPATAPPCDAAAGARSPSPPPGPTAGGPPGSGNGWHGATPIPLRRPDEEDPELAAYNDRLAHLAAEGPKTWRRR